MGEVYENIGEIGYGFFKSFCSEKIDGMKTFFVKNKVGFLPPGMDYSDMQKIRDKTLFKQLKFLIGNHKTLSIILVGLFLSRLNPEIKSKIVSENKGAVYNKHGPEGVSILNIASTGFIESYVQWLTDYNIRENPSKQELIDIYESVLKGWEESSVFVQSCMNENTIIEKIVAKINMGKKVFFVFASGSAIYNTEKIIVSNTVSLKNIHGYKYTLRILNDNEGEKVWIFEKINLLLRS